MLRCEGFSIAQVESVRVEKVCARAEEFEFAARQLLPAEIGELGDERVLARHDFGEVEASVFDAHAPCAGVIREVHDFGGVEQRLRRHAAAQDAQAADFFAAFDNDSFQAGASGGTRRSVAGAAAAEDGQIKVELLQFAHAVNMRNKETRDKSWNCARKFFTAGSFRVNGSASDSILKRAEPCVY